LKVARYTIGGEPAFGVVVEISGIGTLRNPVVDE
jgi:hypothetical protein